jgi:glycosyltransferase involved in cell wall biosynthesis
MSFDKDSKQAGHKLPRVAHLSSVHPWNDVRIFIKEARSLASAGYDITVVAQRSESAVVDGVHCVAIPFTTNRFGRMLLGPWRVFRNGCNYDIVHFHDSELIPIGILLKLLGKRVIYDVHEDLPRQIADKHWIWSFVRKPIALFAELIERVAARALDRIVAVTPEIGSRFPPDKTVIVQNYPLPSELCLREGAIEYKDRPRNFAYVGNVTEARGAKEMVTAIERLNCPDARLVIAGNIAPRSLLGELEAHEGWKRTSYRGLLDRPEVARLLGSARAGIVVFHPIGNYINARPHKLFEYMSVGLPVIASDFPLWREFVGDNRAGLLVDPHNPDMIAQAMRWILDNPTEAEAMGQRGQHAVATKFNWHKEAEKLIALYASLV